MVTFKFLTTQVSDLSKLKQRMFRGWFSNTDFAFSVRK